MIKLTDTDKTLVVPSGLGNFGQSSGGGGGITPEQAAEISSAITAEAITEYDIELQVDLEEIREAVSGNTEAIGNLSDSLSAYTTDSELQQALREYATTAQTQAISDSLANYATTAQTQEIAGDVAELSGATQAVEQSLGNYATTADTQAISDSLANYATTAVTDGLETEISGLTASVSTLSGNVKEDVYLDVAVIDSMSYAERKTLWDEVYAKVVAGHKVFAKGGVQNSPAYTAVLPLDKHCPETNTETHVGGFLNFAAKDSEENIYFRFSFSSNGNLGGLSASSRLDKTNIYTLPTASSSTKGGVKVGTGLTIDGNANLSISSAVTAEIAGKQDKVKTIVLSTYEQSEFTQDDLDALQDMVDYLADFNRENLPPARILVDQCFYTLIGFGENEGAVVEYIFTYAGNNAGQYGDEGNPYIAKFVVNVADVSQSFESYWDYEKLTASSGITMQDGEISVKIGDGLGFSGDTLVVSGGTSSNTKVVMLNKLSQQERLDLYDELAAMYDYGTNSWTSAYTEDMYAFFLDLREFSDQQSAGVADEFEGFFPMQCARMHPSDYGGAAFFTGVEGSRVGNGWLIDMRFVIDYQGNVDGPSSWYNGPSEQVQYHYDFFITTGGTIANDQDRSQISDDERIGTYRMRIGGDDCAIGNFKWYKRYVISYNDEDKWYYVWSADIPIGNTVYTGIWGMIQDEWYTDSTVQPHVISWTSGATFNPPYSPSV